MSMETTILEALVDRLHELAIDWQTAPLFARHIVLFITAVTAVLALDYHVV